MTEPPGTRWSGWRPRVAIAVLVIAVFLPTLWFTQSGIDDHWLWSEDSPLRRLDGEVVRHIFFELDARARHDVGTEYLPVRDLLVALDMKLWGASFRGPHATQLVLYVVSVLALGGLLVRMRLRADIAWVATALWAIHPLHVETVAWLSERKGVLAGLFVIALGHCWVRYRDSGERRWLALAVLATIAGTWSKAPAMFAPAAFAAWDWFVLSPHRRRWIAVATIGAATVLAAIPVLLVAQSGGIVDNAFKVAPDSRPVAALGAMGHYTLGMLGSRAPAMSYPVQSIGASLLDLVVGAAAVAACAALAITSRIGGLGWRRVFVAWAAIWFVPISQLIFRVHIPVADRYVYLWILAPCAGMAALLAMSRGVIRLAATLALIGLFSIQTMRALEGWTGGLQLYTRAFESNPWDARMCENLARARFTWGDPGEALAVLDLGLAHVPDEPYLLGTKAMVLDAIHVRDEALTVSARAAASGHASLNHDHAGMLVMRLRFAEALPFAEHAATRRPEHPEYTWRRIAILVELNRFGEAERIARELAQRFPGSASQMVLARLYAEWGRIERMRVHLVLAGVFGAHRGAIASTMKRAAEITGGPAANQ